MRTDRDDELAREIRTHLELEAEEHEAAGVPRREAIFAARRAFGSITGVAEDARSVRSWQWWDSLRRDIRFAVRGLTRDKRFTAATVATLGFGVALVTTTLTFVDVYLIRPLPYPGADRLYHVFYAPAGQREPPGLTLINWSSLEDVVEVADDSTSGRFYLRDGTAREELIGLHVAQRAIDILQVRALHGRGFVSSDFAPDATPVALMGHAVWQARYGGDLGVIGRVLSLHAGEGTAVAEPFEIIGVLPRDFRWAREYARDPLDLAVPLRERGRVYMVRLRHGVNAAAASERITAAARATAGSSVTPDWQVRLLGIQERYVEALRPILMAVAMAVGLVLAIVIANVAILTLLRAMRRERELAVRVALGAGRAALVRLCFGESLVVCGAAFVVGSAISAIALGRLAPIVAMQFERPVPGGETALGLTPELLAVGAVACLALALVLGMLPLLGRGTSRLLAGLHSAGRATTEGLSIRWARSGLIALEIAGSLALLVGCGLMVRTAINLLTTDLGLRTDGIIRTRLAVTTERYTDPAALVAFHKQLMARLPDRVGTPTALIDIPPLFQAVLRPIESTGADSLPVAANVMTVSPGYFDVMGVGVVQGRSFSDQDDIGREYVAMVSESAARRLAPQGSAVGREIRIVQQSTAGGRPGRPRTVIGVVRDVRQTFQDSELADVYLPQYQEPSRFAQVLMRAGHQDGALRGRIAESAGAIERDALISPVTPLNEDLDRLLQRPRLLTSMLTGFAGFSLVLALLGLYGVTAYATEQRARELAVRAALGATRHEITRLLLRGGVVIIGVGVGLGLLGAGALSGALRQQLHGVPPFDPSTVTMATVVIAGCGLVAIWGPAYATASRNPATVLNRES